MHNNPSFIEGNEQLASACERWLALDAIGLDTEFERTRTYYSRPALVQVFDGIGVALIDPLAVDDFGPLRRLLECTAVTKVMHASEGDVEILEQLSGATPQPIFDTQVAAAFGGYGHSLGYRRLTEAMLGEEIAKDETRSDWLRRPLSDAQIAYAALDVVHLLPMYERLERELVALGRDAWLREEIVRVQRRRELDRDPQRASERIRQRRHLDGRGLWALRELAAWREREARKRDVPRQMILKDAVLMEIAATLPSTSEDLSAIAELSAKACSRYATTLLDIAGEARAAPDEALPEPVTGMERRYAARLKALKATLAERAHALGLPAPLLAQSRTLEALVQNAAGGSYELPEELLGWRAPVIGEALLGALQATAEQA